MHDPEEDRESLLHSLRELVRGAGDLDEVMDLAFEIRERWSQAPPSEVSPEADGEKALWAAVWELTASCRDSPLDADSRPSKNLRLHVRLLEGSEQVPNDWVAGRR